MSVSSLRRSQTIPTLEEIRAEQARRSLRSFVRHAWHVVEPSTPFVPGWHLDAICEHLEAVTRGELRNVIINVPPRHMKSLAVSVFWPCWEWIAHPERRWLFASYAQPLSTRDSLKCRRLIMSPWYQQHWSDVYELTGDQNAKTRFENDKTGYRIATSVGGIGTGEGGDRVVVDDPHNVKEAESDTVRESTLEWWDQAMSTRGNDPKTVARIIVMQRVHENDLTGHVLAKAQEGGQQYDHLVLPARFEPTVQVCAAELQHEQRSEPDALLWPERFGEAELAALEIDLGEMGTAGQLQQRPAPAGGAVFKRDWWDGKNLYDPADDVLARSAVARWIFTDTAYKDAAVNDYTAVSVFDMLPDYRFVWRWCWWEKLTFPRLLDEIESAAVRWNADGKLREVPIEDKGSGTSAIQTLQNGAPAWLAEKIRPFTPLGSKEYRARQASLWCARDCILIPMPSEAAPWRFEATEQLFKFPAAAHDDIVDTFSMGIIYLEHLIAQGWRVRNGLAA
jgi:predicted phage terminase large subunit-like protein